MNVLNARDNLRSKNLHLLDDSSIDYKYANEFLDKITWFDIFFGNENCKPIGLQWKLQAYILLP